MPIFGGRPLLRLVDILNRLISKQIFDRGMRCDINEVTYNKWRTAWLLSTIIPLSNILEPLSNILDPGNGLDPLSNILDPVSRRSDHVTVILVHPRDLPGHVTSFNMYPHSYGTWESLFNGAR